MGLIDKIKQLFSKKESKVDETEEDDEEIKSYRIFEFSYSKDGWRIDFAVDVNDARNLFIKRADTKEFQLIRMPFDFFIKNTEENGIN